jgi:hypothetical protein
MASRIFDSVQYFGGEECQTLEHGVQRLSGDKTTLLIDIRGFVKNPNTTRVRAAYGVFFGNGSSFNRNDVVPEHVPKNDQVLLMTCNMKNIWLTGHRPLRSMPR